jgi:hypothetical protein
MATSLPPVYLPAGQWVDLYSATGITVGAKLNAHNPYQTNVYLTEADSEPGHLEATPSERTIGINILRQGQDRQNRASAVGAWAFAFKDTNIQVEEA